MESNNEFKEINTENRTCYYFDDMTNINDLDLEHILLDEKTYENILIYNTKLHMIVSLYILFLIK